MKVVATCLGKNATWSLISFTWYVPIRSLLQNYRVLLTKLVPHCLRYRQVFQRALAQAHISFNKKVRELSNEPHPTSGSSKHVPKSYCWRQFCNDDLRGILQPLKSYHQISGL